VLAGNSATVEKEVVGASNDRPVASKSIHRVVKYAYVDVDSLAYAFLRYEQAGPHAVEFATGAHDADVFGLNQQASRIQGGDRDRTGL